MVRIKLLDMMVRELKYVDAHQLKKNVISIGALEAQGLEGTLREGVLKMFNGSLIVLKAMKSPRGGK